jgi:predicted nuclease of restriction endonuclease-like (RecB) superfamily
MNYYNEIKNKLIDDEVYSRTKDYSKERHRVITYFETGKLLSEAGGKYGDHIIDEYSKKLVVEVNKKYNRSTLFRMRKFYNVFGNEKVATMLPQLTWSHYLLLLPIKNYDEITYYVNISKNNNLTQRQLQDKIKSNEYGRLPEETKNKLIIEDRTEIKDLVPNPILIRNKNNIETITEKILHNLILEDIESFMKELGNSFSFIGSEYKISISNTYNYIDLLLFNYEYNCFVVVELKVTELKKEHIGQIQIYMNYIDENLRKTYHDKTIGLIICKRNNEYIIEYSSDKRIIAREYETI